MAMMAVQFANHLPQTCLRMKLTEMHEDVALNISVNATLQLSSGNRFQKFKDQCTTHFCI